MSDAFLDSMPSRERHWYEELKKRSPEEYERIREKVRGQPERAKEEMRRNAEFAEFSFAMETEPKLKISVKNSIEESIKHKGVEKVVEGKLDKKAKSALEAGHFDVIVDNTEKTPRLKVTPKAAEKGSGVEAPMGNVTEALPLKKTFQDTLILSFNIRTNKNK